VRRLLLPITAEEALTPSQISDATVDPALVVKLRGADGQLARLGGGSFGQVFAGKMQFGSSWVDVALKRMVTDKAAPLTSDSAATQQCDKQFWREVVLHRTCSSHPNVVRCYGGFVRHTDGGVPERWAVLERCSGSLAQALHGRAGKPVDFEQRLLWAQQIVSALAYLHARDIVHGDVKSDNVLLDDSASVKVSDLGASALRRDETSLAADTSHMGERGSPVYMCPCLALERTPLTKSSDVYSCGVLLCEMLCLTYPYSCAASAGITTPRDLYKAVAGGLRPVTPAALARLSPARHR